MIKPYIIGLLVLIVSLLPNPAKAQIEKVISIESTPLGAIIYDKGNRNKMMGKTPLVNNFSFHSKKSLKKITLKACGYYDTTIVINPEMALVNVEIEKKPLVFTIDTDGNEFTAIDIERAKVFVSGFLEAINTQMQGSPISTMDYIVLKKTGETIGINIAFITEPENIGIKMSENMDSILAFVWDKWFKDKISEGINSGSGDQGEMKVYISLISSNEKLAIRHIPGVDVRDVWHRDISQVVTKEYIITTTETYYQTESDALFNYTLEKNLSYYEFIYTVDINDLSSYKDCGLLYVKNGKLIKSHGTIAADGFLYRRINKDKFGEL